MKTTPVTERKFDWKSHHDPKSRSYPIRALLPSTVDRTVPKLWPASSLRIDQGAEGACVGFGWTGEALASPMRATIGNNTTVPAEAFARSLYKEAQTIDDWPGEAYSGTSVLAGAKIFVQRGLAEEYRWAFSVDDIIDALCAPAKDNGGPVVVGIPWYASMYTTRPNGLVTVDPNSELVGGHCILLTGWHPNMRFGGFNGGWRHLPVIKWRNSWGPSYGKKGDGYITPEILSWLLKDTGEACIPVGRKIQPLIQIKGKK